MKLFNETNLSIYQSRYGKEIPDNKEPTNEFIEQIISRRTIRRFSNKKISKSTLKKLFAAAQSAPTSSMIQPWSAIVIEDKNEKLKLFEGEFAVHMGVTGKNPSDKGNFSAVTECSAFIIWLVDCSFMDYIFDLDSEYTTEEERVNAKIASRLMSIELRSITDTIIAAQTFSLCAESMGLGTMWCGSIRTMDLKEHFNLPDRVMPLAGMCVGYPQENLNTFGGIYEENYNVYAKPRLPQEAIIHKNIYNKENKKYLQEYNNLMSVFYNYYNLGADWFKRVVKRTRVYNDVNKDYRKLAQKYGFDFL